MSHHRRAQFQSADRDHGSGCDALQQVHDMCSEHHVYVVQIGVEEGLERQTCVQNSVFSMFTGTGSNL